MNTNKDIDKSFIKSSAAPDATKVRTKGEASATRISQYRFKGKRRGSTEARYIASNPAKPFVSGFLTMLERMAF